MFKASFYLKMGSDFRLRNAVKLVLLISDDNVGINVTDGVHSQSPEMYSKEE